MIMTALIFEVDELSRMKWAKTTQRQKNVYVTRHPKDLNQTPQCKTVKTNTRYGEKIVYLINTDAETSNWSEMMFAEE